MGTGQDLYKEAKKIIPGGTQLLSKRPEQFLPEFWPAYYDRAKGCKVWDLDGTEYTDTSYMGIGANILGYCVPQIDDAVKEAIAKGNMSTLNAPEEVYLANKLLDIHKWADMVRYAKAGGEAMAQAVRIARAYTGKDKVLFCGYHGWQDWYLAANITGDDLKDHLLPGLAPSGVPKGLKGTNIPFYYNNTDEFFTVAKANEGEVAAVVMEPIRNDMPKENFLEQIRSYTKEKGIVLIFDEITAGFRLNCGGSHLLLGVNPDIAVFGKALGNGYPLTAIIGTKEVMNAAQTSFISSTYWTERIGFCAALATIDFYEKNKVEKHLEEMGKKVQEGWRQKGEKHGLKIHTGGIYPLSHFSFEVGEPLVYKTFYTQEMLKKGFLATTAFYASYAHTNEDIDRYLQATDEVFATIKAKGVTLDGEVCHSGFKRLN